MKKSIITFLLLVLTSSFTFSQVKCNCEQALNQLIDKIESDYPGFNEKTIDKLSYNNFKEGLKVKSQSIKESDCIELLKSYKAFFRDGHIDLELANGNMVTHKNEKYYGKIEILLDDFYKHISKSADELEGVWKSNSYKLGIIKKDDEYQAFIIEADTAYWKPYEIKFRLKAEGKANFYLRDHSLREEDYTLSEGSILFFTNSRSTFIKELPKPKLTQNEINSKINEIEGIYCKKLTEKTILLCLSTFEYTEVERIEKLIDENIGLIENCENLIIDVRNNLGGTDDAYQKLLPYICTNPIRFLGSEYLATQTLIDGLQNWIDITPNEEKYEADKKMVKGWIKLFKEHPGKFVNTNSTDFGTIEVKIAEHSPKQIIILANKSTASSGECFVYNMKQSKKVKVMGIPTYGALDYGSKRWFDFGCENYKLALPTWRDMRLPDYPIDNIGIQPDIYLDKYVKDWVQYAVDYLENKK